MTASTSQQLFPLFNGPKVLNIVTRISHVVTFCVDSIFVKSIDEKTQAYFAENEPVFLAPSVVSTEAPYHLFPSMFKGHLLDGFQSATCHSTLTGEQKIWIKSLKLIMLLAFAKQGMGNMP